MDRPLLPLVIDDAAALLVASPEARDMVHQLLLTRRRNGSGSAASCPTADELEGAASQR